MKKLFVLLLLLFPLVEAATVEIISPEDGFEHHLNNPEVKIEILTDFDIAKIHYKTKCFGETEWTNLGTEKIDAVGVNSYSANVVLMKEGDCQLTVQAISRKDEEGNSDWDVDSISFTGIPDFPFATKVVRNIPKIFYPGGQFYVYLNYYIAKDYEITGLIIKDSLPEGFNLIAPCSGYDFVWDIETKTLKFALKGAPLNSGYVCYIVSTEETFEPGTEVEFNGSYEWLNSSQMPITEEKITKAAGFIVPGCPMNDQQFLDYINKWAKMELGLSEEENDNIIMQIIQVWKSC